MCQAADGFGQFTKLCFLHYYANYVPRLGCSLAESQSISYFSPDVRTPIKTKQCFLTRRLTDLLEKKIYQSLGGVFFFFFLPHSPQGNSLPGTRTWTSSIWRTNPKRSHEVLNGRNRESGAQTPARRERGRKRRCSVRLCNTGWRKKNLSTRKKTQTCAAQLVRENTLFLRFWRK